jgi:hypothetical protein
VVAEEDPNRAVKLTHAALLHEALAGEEAVSARLGCRHETQSLVEEAVLVVDFEHELKTMGFEAETVMAVAVGPGGQ